MTLSLNQCQIRAGGCTKLGMKYVRRNGVRYYSCDECAKATNRRANTLNRMCPLCGERGSPCQHTLTERLEAQALKQEIIQEAKWQSSERNPW